MKVAIMGAGLSGLSCAIMLERKGVLPTIFEKRSRVGDRFVNAEAFLSILSRPVGDNIKYLSETYKIFLKPLSNLRKINILSENESAVLEGHLGFINLRGRDADSYDNQLFKQVKSQIIFNSKKTYEQLLKEFTHVIVATGDAEYTSEIQDYQKDITVTLKGATIEGNFDRYSVRIWLDNRIAPKGYGFFLPYSDKEACITIAFPEYPGNREKDIQELWDIFYSKVCKSFGQNLKITDSFEINRYIIGQCKYPRIGNTFFTGNCFGAIMPAFGFGQFASILTGIYAAQDILGEGQYEQLVKPLQESYKNSLILRRNFERLDNKGMDKIVGLVDNNLVQRILNSKRYDPLKIASYLLRPFARKI